MKFKSNYIVIPLTTVAVALLGSYFTSSGMFWYDTELIMPSVTPPRWAFPVAWNTIFTLATISALIVWNKAKHDEDFKWIERFTIANIALNILWSFLFFYMNRVGLALLEMIVLELTIIPLIALTWRTSKFASLCLVPYALWVGFATYLTYLIWVIN
jgi:benzodiazapine receptor